MPNIPGTEDDDSLLDTAGDDAIDALGGDDSITVSNGRDDVHGGAGSDTLIVDYGDATTRITTQGGGDQPARPEPDGSGGYEGFIGDLINRFVSFDGIEKFVISTGNADDVIQLPNGANVTDDVVNLGGGNDETALGRGIDVADGGTGTDGLDADQSQVAVAISINLNTNTYSGAQGTSFTNFEYFADRDGGFRTGTGNDNVVTGTTDLDDNVRLGAGNDSVTIYDGQDFLVGYGLDTPEGEGGFDSLVVDYSAATTAITTDGGFLQGNADGYDGRLTDGVGGTRFALFFGFDRFDITTGSGNDVFNYFNLVNDADNIFHLGAGNDSVNLSQSTGDNYLDGGSGNDTMTGGFGNDTYVVDSASDVVNDFFGGIDEVRTDLAGYALASDLENLTGIGNVNQALTGNASANVIDGGLGNDALNGLAGNDTLKVAGGTTGANTGVETVDGGADSDLLIVDYGAMTDQVGLYVQSDGAGGATGFADIPDGARHLTFTAVERLQITTGTGNDTVNGFFGDDVINTGAGNDLIIAGGGNDALDGGTGSDEMRGGLGNDSYAVDDNADQVVENAGEGTDAVVTALATYTLSANVENLTGTSIAGQVLIGEAGANTITGAAGNDRLTGHQGGDTLDGGLGTDTVDYSLEAGPVGVIVNLGESPRLLSVIPFFDMLNASSARDSFGSTDTLSGIENVRTGDLNDQVFGSVLDNRIETGAGSDYVEGGAGKDYVDGGAGTDTMLGGTGDDYYIVDDLADAVNENAGEGVDTIRTALSAYSLESRPEVENLTGGTGDQSLTGNAGANVLQGGGGVDTLTGLAGNDVYYTDVAATQVVEASGGGTDALYTSVSYTLQTDSEVELLSANRYGATAAINLAGNRFDNILIGNAGANVLQGGGGSDTLIGLAGDDIYYSDVAATQIVETAGGGSDRLYTSVSYTLGGNAEVELLSANNYGATGAINLTGNGFDQTIIGNAGANVLHGGGGTDTLVGLTGNDVYYVDVADTQVLEYADSGTDALYVSTSYALAAGQSIETLSANDHGATAEIDLSGNDLANTIFGNAGDNVIDGKGGSDQLVGFGGADVFAFTTALGQGNIDVVYGFESGTDKIGLDNAIFTGLEGPGGLDAGVFVMGSAALDGDDRIIYNAETGQLLFDGDGSGAGTAVQFASLATGLDLTASDFLVI